MKLRSRSIGERAATALMLHVRTWTGTLLWGTALLVLLTGCVFGDDNEVATEREGVSADITATALAALPEGVEEATITITNGAFDVESLILQEGQPSVLHVVNRDDTAFRLKVGDDLVTATSIGAGTTTDIEFTTPNAASYEGQLLAAESDDVLATVVVRVQSAGGLQP